MGGVDRGDQLRGYYNNKISCKMNDDTGQFKVSRIVNQLLDKTKHLLEKDEEYIDTYIYDKSRNSGIQGTLMVNREKIHLHVKSENVSTFVDNQKPTRQSLLTAQLELLKY